MYDQMLTVLGLPDWIRAHRSEDQIARELVAERIAGHDLHPAIVLVVRAREYLHALEERLRHRLDVQFAEAVAKPRESEAAGRVRRAFMQRLTDEDHLVSPTLAWVDPATWDIRTEVEAARKARLTSREGVSLYVLGYSVEFMEIQEKLFETADAGRFPPEFASFSSWVRSQREKKRGEPVDKHGPSGGGKVMQAAP